ncbi:barstar family protein [Streptomyces griseoincarnatus]|uniref:barstar family protein n=1 Tax=unclassified Streptomyces TaxID=2593676 RepID=UPI0027DEA228|nr:MULTISPECIES: barstar family protein [unclassified Streptomyces]
MRCATPRSIYRLLQRDLRFPDFYGRNWDALRDASTGLAPARTSRAGRVPRVIRRSCAARRRR